MWLKWLPWRYILRNAAKKHDFLDPFELFSRLQNFAQPAEVAAPLELLRAGAVFHARGLINSQAIQHNLDWIWPYWVERQFNPASKSFVPRAFSLTHVNLTHRNWTAVGVPDMEEWPIVDPRGLVTPFLDGWSLDAWIVPDQGEALIPSRSTVANQKLEVEDGLQVITEVKDADATIRSTVDVKMQAGQPVCFIKVDGRCSRCGFLVVALRPANPEGVSFIHDIRLLDHQKGWVVNQKQCVEFDQAAERCCLSEYKQGDVFRFIKDKDLVKNNNKQSVKCKVGMATAAALFPLSSDMQKEIHVRVPLITEKRRMVSVAANHDWNPALEGSCRLKVGDKQYQFLYDAAIRTLVLLSPDEVYPGPYTYRRFWFRDAAIIIYALVCSGFHDRAKRVLATFPKKQSPMGYFLSQEGEWDSNGEALWALHQYSLLTGEKPDPQWRNCIIKGANWIQRKRLVHHQDGALDGLFPAGFSAEHLGPNDYYYWDDFWGVAGLRAASALLAQMDAVALSQRYKDAAQDFMQCIENSLHFVKTNLGQEIIPAAPYRRMDAGAIGSIISGYPLQLLTADDPRLLGTIDFLYRKCLYQGGFFQDMTHSGINPYLTLHMAQVMLRAGDPRYLELMQSVADAATPTGQWPEAVHPQTGGGCMGDGQHAWAAAEWLLMMRSCFVREEDDTLILCSGIPASWLEKQQTISFGPVWTSFGKVVMQMLCQPQGVRVSWSGQWHHQPPAIEVRLPGYAGKKVVGAEQEIFIKRNGGTCAS